MGHFATLYVNGHEAWSSKYDVESTMMTLFQRHERSLIVGSIEDVAPSMLDEDGSNAKDEIEILKYRTTVGAIRERLDLMGFTIEFARSEFEEGRQREILQIEEYDGSHAEEETRVLKELFFDCWLKVFGMFWTNKERWYKAYKSGSPPEGASLDDLLMWYVSTRDYDEPWCVFQLDLRLILRSLCEVLPPDAPVVYDLSDLIFETGEELAQSAEAHLDGGYATTRRIIVLTEGRTDQRAVEGALSLLRPSVTEYFSFLDFESMAVPGGVTSVVNILKAFISIGICNRIIALLDNDSAAHAAVQSAKLGTLPDNVRIVFLPDLPIARKYPTLGPSGMTDMDVNSLACSIELYFGADVLKYDGYLAPIQWTGYQDRLKRYQGEIMKKAELQSRFSEKLAKAKQDPSVIPSQDWTAMEMVVQSLVTAFRNVPPMDYGLERIE
jgi:hypothetical protein